MKGVPFIIVGVGPEPTDGACVCILGARLLAPPRRSNTDFLLLVLMDFVRLLLFLEPM
jgi:hypothetical protein